MSDYAMKLIALYLTTISIGNKLGNKPKAAIVRMGKSRLTLIWET